MSRLRIVSVIFMAALLGVFIQPGEGAPPSAPVSRENGRAEVRKETGERRFLDRSEIALFLENELQKSMGDGRKTVRVKDLQGGERVALPPGDLSWEVKFSERFHQGGSVPVALILRAGVQKVQEVRLQARVEIYADVVVARNYLRRHQVVEEKDVQVVNRNIAPLPPDIVTDLEEVVGKRMTLSLNIQEVLRKSMVEVPPLVKKGDRVTLLVENAVFRISCAGEVKEEGRRGDRVKVVNVSSKKEVYGRVLDAHTVQVNF